MWRWSDLNYIKIWKITGCDCEWSGNTQYHQNWCKKRGVRWQRRVLVAAGEVLVGVAWFLKSCRQAPRRGQRHWSNTTLFLNQAANVMAKSSDIDDCERPACDDVRSMFAKAMAASKKADSGGAEAKPRVSKQTGIECPPNRSTIGKGSWTLIHSMVRLVLSTFCLARMSFCFFSILEEDPMTHAFLFLSSFKNVRLLGIPMILVTMKKWKWKTSLMH